VVDGAVAVVVESEMEPLAIRAHEAVGVVQSALGRPPRPKRGASSWAPQSGPEAGENGRRFSNMTDASDHPPRALGPVSEAL